MKSWRSSEASGRSTQKPRVIVFELSSTCWRACPRDAIAKVRTRDEATKYTALTDWYLALGSKSLARVGYINAGTNT